MPPAAEEWATLVHIHVVVGGVDKGAAMGERGEGDERKLKNLMGSFFPHAGRDISQKK